MGDVQQGQTHPLGATVRPRGTNFSIYSEHCAALELLFFDRAEDSRPSRVVELDADRGHRTYHFWHAFVPGVREGQIYAYRAHGPNDPERGLRYDSGKALLDPYGRSVVVPSTYDRAAVCRPGDTMGTAMKSVVADLSRYDWEGDAPLRRPFEKTVIYEMHVAGFTRHPSSGVARERRGTYLGLVDKIPYLVDLGVTAVELLPVFQFDRQDAPPGLCNYWGYDPVSFFAPHSGYATSDDPLGVLDEFRDMVKALHRAGIEIILDVVYNHTAESNELGPTLCYRGLDNPDYYLLEPRDRARYANYSGTGNTLNANHAIVRRLIVDSLRYWVAEMHVDGFRFDLASILSRNTEGRPVQNPPVLWDIETDPVLGGTKLIAEAWDAAGLYQVGSFFGDRWKEWNGRFRDDVRAFLRGDDGYVKALAERLFASPDIYGDQNREPTESVNFVTCHDGFTLNDLVSYNDKHNSANQQDNTDGSNDNRSWNCGIEGETQDAVVEALRLRQIKNFFTINLLSVGVPMISMGDEVRRSQRGNNNPYCQDNELNWFDWGLVDTHQGLHRFVKALLHFRLGLPAGGDLSLRQMLARMTVHWHGVKLHQPDFAHYSHSLAFAMTFFGYRWHFMINAYTEPLTFELPRRPAAKATPWRRLIDTFKEPPEDFCDPSDAPIVEALEYRVEAHSIVVLVAEERAAIA